MRTLLLSLVFLFVHGSSIAEERAQSVRTATYNVNWGNPGDQRFLDAILTSNADVVFLQETTSQSERFLKWQLLKASYPYFHATGHDGRFAAERFAFASKIPLQEVAFTPPDKGLFGFYSASCDLGGTRTTLINVHLTPFGVQRGSDILQMITTVCDTERTHAAEIGDVCKRLNAKRPTIVAGDFNSISTFVAPSQLRKAGLIDSFAATHDNAAAHPTWSWYFPTWPLPLALRCRIDYIFHTNHFCTIRSDVIESGGSDHFLLVSELMVVDPTHAPKRAAAPASRGDAPLPAR
jgi:endonuclease/exonuclease/phosphatase (EEP) superfamily protein YafD